MKRYLFLNVYVKGLKGLFLLLCCSVSLFSQEELAITYSVNGGLYNKAFELSIITSDEKAIIYYTTDGSLPSGSSNKYKKVLNIDTTKIVRAIAIAGKKRSVVFSQSYLFLGREVNFPVLSIQVDPEKMFNPYSGLYAKGPNASAEPPYKGANFHKDKELLINIEYFSKDGKQCFNQPAGLKIFGAYSRMFPQKSLSIISRSAYGKKNFDFPIFPDLPYKKYKSFILRNGGSDNNRAHFRDIFMSQLVKDLSFDIQSYRTVVVYINGEYWGIYNIREKFNEHFLKQHHGVNKDSVSIMKHRSDLKIGKRLNYKKVVSFIGRTDFSDSKMIDSLNKLIDITNFLDYNISQTYFANTDAGGNIRYWRSWRDTGRWKWLMFDTDFGFGLDGAKAYEKNTVSNFTTRSNEAWPYPSWSTLFVRGLLENDSIKSIYINKFCIYLNTILDSNVVVKKLDAFIDSFDQEIDFQHDRWGSNRERWNKELDRMRAFGINRKSYIEDYLKERFELDTMFNVTIDVPANGRVIYNGVSIHNKFEGAMFGGINHYIKAVPNEWFKFYMWEGIEVMNASGSYNLDKNVHIKAVFRKKERSKWFGKLKFSELCLKCKEEGGDWIELYNNSDEEIDISSSILIKDSDKRFVLPDSTIIKPNGYLLLARNTIDVDSLVSIKRIKGLFTLKDTGIIELYSPEGNLVDSIFLDFNGSSHIELINPSLSGFDKDDWEDNMKLSPGKINYAEVSNNQFKLLLVYGILPLLILIFIISIIFVVLRKRKKNRPHSSTE